MVGVLAVVLLGNAFVQNEEKNRIAIIEKEEDVIRTYLNDKTEDIVSSEGKKCFSAFDILGARKDKVYLWVLKYNESGGAGSMPVVLNVENKGAKFIVVSHEIPRDGDYFDDDVERLFPIRLRNKAFGMDREYGIRIENLEKQIEKMRRTACSPHFFMDIMFLLSSFILSVRLCSFPSILISRYILIAIGNPTLAIRDCISEFIRLLLSMGLGGGV